MYATFSLFLHQVNEVNGGDNVRSMCVCLCVCVSACVCVQWTGQSDQFKTVKATEFKYDISQRQSGRDPLQIFRKGRGQRHVTP